ncbi:MAG TPA: SDR family oxidoreductase, partial [Spirochaetia bacterium]|nr:SDR family oxidoreductase [Spirochaetia bacterium]
PLIHYSNPNYEFIHGDITDPAVQDSMLEDVDCVLHLAAVVGEPASNKFPELTKKINEDASIAIIDKVIKKKIANFFFFSTCSNYGVANTVANEESELHPLSPYSETKINVERYILSHAEEFNWIICRLSTVYGPSPRMRLDLTVNDFAYKAYHDKLIDIFLPESYRPYIHVYDLARVILHLMTHASTLGKTVYNVGFNTENYQKIEIAHSTQKKIDGVKIEILKSGGDKRDYKVDFSKLAKATGLSNMFNVYNTVDQLVRLFSLAEFNDNDRISFNNAFPLS